MNLLPILDIRSIIGCRSNLRLDDPLRFALNHMAAVRLPLAAFFALARDVGIVEVEIRNDLAGTAILDGTLPEDVRAQASAAGVNILSINALQRFNSWDAERAAEAAVLADYARNCGAAALVLVPLNDGSGREDGARQRNLRKALRELSPILSARGLTGLVEPLGFESCSLRSKREAMAAIVSEGGPFKLVHDTFHHHLAGDGELFAEATGLVHISGVTDARIGVAEMRDSHRVLVDGDDRLDSIGQVRALLAAGYQGPLSFEPFATRICTSTNPGPALRASRDFVVESLRASAPAGG